MWLHLLIYKRHHWFASG